MHLEQNREQKMKTAKQQHTFLHNNKVKHILIQIKQLNKNKQQQQHKTEQSNLRNKTITVYSLILNSQILKVKTHNFCV